MQNNIIYDNEKNIYIFGMICDTKNEEDITYLKVRPFLMDGPNDMRTIRCTFDAKKAASKLTRGDVCIVKVCEDVGNPAKSDAIKFYTKGYSGFSCRLFCGNCCKMLEADSRTLSINGQKKKYKIWCCRKCPGQREFDDVIRKATQSLFNEPQCEGLFAQNIEKAIIYNDRIDFYFKEGKVITWEKE